MTEQFEVKERGAEALPSAVTQARQLLDSSPRGFILLTLNDEGVESVVGCHALDLLVLMLAFTKVTDKAMTAMLSLGTDETQH